MRECGIVSRGKKKERRTRRRRRAIGNGLTERVRRRGGLGLGKAKKRKGRKGKKKKGRKARIPYKRYMLSWVSTSEEYDGGDVSLNI